MTDGSLSAIFAIAMGIYLARTFQRRADGSQRDYYVLRENYWDFKQKRQRTRYVAYVGRTKTLSLAKARKLARKIGITLDELRRVRGLRIVEDTPPS